jgi:LDH2 family malate/lactate/ureidoglycolate dehydrogenase
MAHYHVLPTELHNDLIHSAYLHRGYAADEAADATKFCAMASEHGIRTHNGIKALHLDHLFGSGSGGCVPKAEIKVLEKPFPASQVWDAQLKLGQAVAARAMETCMRLADWYGIGQVSVDSAFHYLWGGGYVMEAAKRGYIAYTNCTSTLAEVVPFGGKFPTLGTNPHSWGLPTQDALGYPVVIDWATSTVAMGRVQQLKREGKQLPPDAAVDVNGNPTTDPNEAKWLIPFGKHKGYGLALYNEIIGALIGGSLPTLRGNPLPADATDEKRSCTFYFQVIHPDALGSGLFAKHRNQKDNLKAVLKDVFSHGNETATLPGQMEHQAAQQSAKAGGLLFTTAEVEALNEIARELGRAEIDPGALASYEA